MALLSSSHGGRRARSSLRTSVPRAWPLIGFAALLACGGGSHASSSKRSNAPNGRVEDSSAGSVDLSTSDYKVETVANGGTVQGTLTLTGARPAPLAITSDSALCSGGDDGEPRKGNSLGNAIVWVAGVHAGKSAGIERRIELDSDGCQLDPRVQGAVTGTTVNVFNDDKVLHRLVFIPLGTHDTLTVMPFANAGEVVPSELLAKQAHIVEVLCARHPWTRGYIAVFDNPYFAVTDADGSFTIDSLPPGSYTMNVWHEGMTQPVQQRVQVAPGGSAKLTLAVALSAPSAN